MNENYANKVTKLNNSRKIEGPRKGRIIEVLSTENVLVDFSGNPYGPLPAQMTRTAALALKSKQDASDVEVLLLFENNDPHYPIIIDIIASSTDLDTDLFDNNNDPSKQTDVELNGKRMAFSAEDEIVFKCGKSSITLTKAGKVIIRGAYVVSRSSGVNKIKGGTVHIN